LELGDEGARLLFARDETFGVWVKPNQGQQYVHGCVSTVCAGGDRGTIEI